MAISSTLDHRGVDGIAFGNLGQGLASGSTLQRFLTLVWRELRLATELDTSGLRAFAAHYGALLDQMTLKLRDCCQQQRREKTTLRSRGVPEGVTKRSK